MQQRKTFLSLNKIKSTSRSENFFSGRHYRCRRALRFASVIAAAHITTSESRHFCRCDLAANTVINSEKCIKVEYAYCFYNYSDYVYQKLSKLVHATRTYKAPKLARFLDTVYNRTWWDLFGSSLVCRRGTKRHGVEPPQLTIDYINWTTIYLTDDTIDPWPVTQWSYLTTHVNAA